MAIAYWNLVLAGRFKFLDLWNKFLVVSLIITLKITVKMKTLLLPVVLLQHCPKSLAGAPQKINS